MSKKLTVFIGSSTEGAKQETPDGFPLLTKVAEWIEAESHIPKRWNDTASFPAGEFTLESLVRTSHTVDAAVFILSDDDPMSYRGDEVKMPRDNVLIEYGLFMGTLGEKNVIAGSRGKPKVANDLAGLTLVDLSDNRLVKAETQVKLWLKEVEQRASESEKEVGGLLSQHPYVELIATEADRTDAKVHGINTWGKQLFGYRLDAPDLVLVGKSAGVLPQRLRTWIDPPPVNWKDLKNDQERVYREFYAGGKAVANIPVRFNRHHPYFPGKTFIPIIVQQRPEKKDPGREITGVLYLDVDTLPRPLFLEGVWDRLSKSLDSDGLVKEIKVIEDTVKIPAPSFAGSKSEGPRLLRYLAEIGLYQALDIAKAKGLRQVKGLLHELLSLLPGDSDDQLPGDSDDHPAGEHLPA